MKIARRRRAPRIPTSAMSDIGFLLLVFIMLVSLMNYKPAVKVDYPEARDLAVTQADRNLELTVDADGRLYVDGVAVDKAGMEARIVDFFLEGPSGRVHVIADKDAPYRYVDVAVSTLQLLQHRVVSLVVKEEGE